MGHQHSNLPIAQAHLQSSATCWTTKLSLPSDFRRKQRPSYRIVAMDSRVKRDGKAIEELGFYNPLTDETHLKFEPIIKRLKQGAQPTDTVHNIFVKAKIFEQM